MENEEKKSNKKKKVFKILLGIGAVAGGIYAISKVVPKFNTKVIEPIKNTANGVVSDIKEAAMNDIKEDNKKENFRDGNNNYPQNNHKREERGHNRRPSFQAKQQDRKNKENYKKFSNNNK